MQRKISAQDCLAFIVTLIWCGTLSISVCGQKLPLVFQPQSSLSPVGAYNAEADIYKATPSQESRNKLIFMAISQIDMNFGQYVKTKRHHNAFFQTVLDILEVGAATAISISNGERAKSVIADALGFVQGSRIKVNENLRLLEQQVLVNKMIEKRSIALTVIYDKIGKSNEEYPFERAYIDILAYYEAGTTDSALSSLATDTGTNATNAQKALAIAKLNAGISLAPTKAMVKLSRQNSDVIDAILNNYVKATDKINDADKRIAAADDLIKKEKLQPQPDQTKIAAQDAEKGKANGDKANAQATQQKAEDGLRDVFKSIDLDPVLQPLLDKIKDMYPSDAAEIDASLVKLRAKDGDINDLALIILRFLRVVVAELGSNSAVVTRTDVILQSIH